MNDTLEIQELSSDHKTHILVIQRQILNTQLELANLRHALELIVQKIAKELSIDTDKFTFDLNTLRIVPMG
jgi:hypothetical protein